MAAAAEVTTFCRTLPFGGVGTVIVNRDSATPFVIRIAPTSHQKSDSVQIKGKDGLLGYVQVEINKQKAIFSYRLPGSKTKPTEVKESGDGTGLKPGEKVSYWFSFDRDERRLKYGKGYIMTQTTLLTYQFERPKGSQDDQFDFIFTPTEPKEVVIKETPARQLRRAPRGNPHSMVDAQKNVAFYPYPLKTNWPPVVVDSAHATLDILADHKTMMSASLPTACQEMYENVSPVTVDLDYDLPYDAKLSDAIRYSLADEKRILGKKLAEKSKDGEMSYLRVTVGHDYGNSPGIPYVLEIWPAGSSSPIHNHGNAYAVIKVLHGAITVQIYNKTWSLTKGKAGSNLKENKLLDTVHFTKNQVTWISPNWYQTHKLENTSKSEYCATVQCYKYGKEDELMWPYFDYLEENDVAEFLPDSDFHFGPLKKALLQEYKERR